MTRTKTKTPKDPTVRRRRGGWSARAVAVALRVALPLCLGVAAVRAQDYLTREESWTTGVTAGWTNLAAPTGMIARVDALAPDGAGLTGAYPAQAMPLPDPDAFAAGPAASDGRFTGALARDGNLPRFFAFDFHAADASPSAILFRLCGGPPGEAATFFRALTNPPPAIGAWTRITVPLTHDADWTGGSAEAFSNALLNVEWLHVGVLRRGVGAQRYALDNFCLVEEPPPGTAGLDSDHDGIPDYWEQRHFDGPTNAVAGADSDGDGESNERELWAGTDPRDPLSVVRVAGIHAEDAGMRVWFKTAYGRRYTVEWESPSNTTHIVWRSVAEPVPGGGGYESVPHTNNSRFGWYRMKVGRP